MSELIRFDVESHDGKAAICIEAGKGYWTPWYIAQRRINELKSSRDQYRSNHEKLVEALRLAVDFINKHPADPDINKEQVEAWQRLVKANPDALLAALEAEKGGEL